MTLRRDSRPFAGAGLALAVVLSACATSPGPVDLAAELRAAGLAEELATPVLLDDEMRAWARAAVTPREDVRGRLSALLRGLLSRPVAPFRHRGGVTTSVREAWESGLANCLTFTHLYVRLAREVGVDAHYVRVRDVVGFDREGDLVIVSDHVVAAAGAGSQKTVIDFSERPWRDYAGGERLSDRRALALHYSNLGADAIRAGDAELARRRLETATRIDPELADGWINLGVALRRGGDLAGAEAAYRRALAAEPDQVSAYHNLASLLERRGRGEEARAALAAVEPARLRDPWAALAFGRIALRGGRLDEAERFLRRARRLLPESAEPLAALAERAQAAGDARRARRLAERALRLEPAHPGASALLARLPPDA
jgi:Tfp pilus assembly protein PilF